MTWWRDVLRQCIFLSFFIIPIPIGAYTIHSGSSAQVALISYTVLSFLIPFLYVGMKEATFGPKNVHIKRFHYLFFWIFTAVLGLLFTACLGPYWKTSSFWQWPTIGRDIVFIAIMYGEICVNMACAYIVSAICSRRRKGE